MSIVGRLHEVLGPIRLSPAQRGVNVTFERGRRWRTMHVIEAPHLELSLPVPELGRLRLNAHLGPATLLGAEDGEPVEDIRWRVRTDTPGLAAAIFAEPPWPRRESPLRSAAWPSMKRERMRWRDWLKVVGVVGLGRYAWLVPGADELGMGDPVPMYVLEVERGVATLERRDDERDPVRALGMVRRLVQLATWPDRAMGGLRALAAQLGGEVEGERWAPGASAITIRRPQGTVRVDHELARGALRTRIRVVDVAGAVAYVDGVGADAETVAGAVDALLAQVARPAARGPYR